MALTELNFTDKEANVYLALLKLGKGTVSAIARRAGIQRTTCYNVLDGLISKNFARISGKEPKQEYVAESPDVIIKKLKEKINRSQEQLKKADKVVPQLKSVHNVGNRPKIKFYEGKEGLVQVYEDTLTAQETIRGLASIEYMHKTLPNYFPQYYKRRASKGIAAKGILSATPFGIERTKHDKEEMRQTALIPTDKFSFTPELNIYDNKMMIASWKEKLGIIIESAEIAEAMKVLFDLALEEAKRLDKKIKRGKKK